MTRGRRVHQSLSFFTPALIALGLVAGCGGDESGGSGGGGGGTSNEVPNCGTVTDVDGNTYETVVIGEQCWMRSNLRTSTYDDGTPVPQQDAVGFWADVDNRDGAWCNYDNDPNNDAIYGKLYNGYAVNAGQLCPTGWRVPTEADWEDLLAGLGGDLAAATALLAEDVWGSTTSPPTNSSGFGALPGGRRGVTGEFEAGAGSVLATACFYTSTLGTGYSTQANRVFWLDPSLVIRGDSRRNEGMSIRCVQGEGEGVPGSPVLEPGVYPPLTSTYAQDPCPSIPITSRTWTVSYPDDTSMLLTTELLSSELLTIGCSLWEGTATCDPFTLSNSPFGDGSVLQLAFDTSEVVYSTTTSFEHILPGTLSCTGQECAATFPDAPCSGDYRVTNQLQP